MRLASCWPARAGGCRGGVATRGLHRRPLAAIAAFTALISDLIVCLAIGAQTISRRASNQPGSRRSYSRRERNDFRHSLGSRRSPLK